MERTSNEPVRKSLLDVVQRNLRTARRAMYVTRVVYFGEYFDTAERLWKRMETVVHELQLDYADVPVTGLLLVYPRHYIHVLETSEDVVLQQFQMLFGGKSGECDFGESVVLSAYHHVRQRFLSDWSHLYAIPPVLLEKLENYTVAEVESQMFNCLVKVYTLCERISDATQGKSGSSGDVLAEMGEKLAQYLPEGTVLQFLLDSRAVPLLRSAGDYTRLYDDVPLVRSYNGNLSHRCENRTASEERSEEGNARCDDARVVE